MKYNVTRSTVINADLKKVRALVEDFSHWNSWSPWTIIEPKCKVDVEGTPAKEGHKMTWDGEIIGSGANTIETFNDHKITYNLEFFKPFKSKAKTGFEFKEVKDGTKVTWTMDSSMPFFLFFMIPTMKAWIGMDYDRGLRMLKEMVEKGNVNIETKPKGIHPFKGFSYIGIQRTCTMKEIGPAMTKDFQTLMELLKKNNAETKHWISLYPKMNMKKGEMTYIAAISNEHLKDVDLGESFVTGEIKDTPAFEISHRGAYDFIGNAWSMGMMHLRAKKIKQSGIPFEYYWNSPYEVEPKDLKTSIYFPIKEQ